MILKVISYVSYHICQANNSRSDLASINSELEQSHLTSLVNQNPADYWIGLSDRLQEGSWKWEDGSSFHYKNWADGKVLKCNTHDAGSSPVDLLCYE